MLPVVKVYGDELGEVEPPEICPNRFDRRAIGENLIQFDNRVRTSGWTLDERLSMVNALDDLPMDDSTFTELVVCMIAEEVPLLAYAANHIVC